MAYTKTTWNTGDVITAEKLNNLEQGVEDAAAGPGTPGADGVTPVITATASVDGNTGTPSVEVTKSGSDEAPVFAFAFKNLKGATGVAGAKGDTGATGADGKSITAIELTKDSSGNITGGTATMSDMSTIKITVTEEDEEST